MKLHSKFAMGIAIAGTLLFGAVPALADSDTIVFDLVNHPDGNQAPPTYGLRLDTPGTSATQTFSFNTNGGLSSVQGIINLNTGVFTINGVIEHIQSGNQYGLSALIQLNNIGSVSINELLNPSAGEAVLTTGNTLSLVLTDIGDGAYAAGPSNWEGFMNPSFELGRNHRLNGADSEYPAITGNGWLAPTGNPSDHEESQDWLFVMENPVVPVPPAAGLMALGFAGVALLRRRGTQV